MTVTVLVKRRSTIADPAGTAVGKALRDLGYTEVDAVRIDKVITLELDGDDPSAVEARVEEMCQKLLANPVMEDYEIQVVR